MIDDSIPYDELYFKKGMFCCQHPTEMARLASGAVDFKEWLRRVLGMGQYHLGRRLRGKGLFFDAVAETEIWFDPDKWGDLTVMMVAKISGEHERAAMTDADSSLREQLSIKVEDNGEIAQIMQTHVPSKEWLRYVLGMLQDTVGWKMERRGIFFDTIGETELWFEAKHDQIKVTMVAVTK